MCVALCLRVAVLNEDKKAKLFSLDVLDRRFFSTLVLTLARGEAESGRWRRG